MTENNLININNFGEGPDEALNPKPAERLNQKKAFRLVEQNREVEVPAKQWSIGDLVADFGTITSSSPPLPSSPSYYVTLYDNDGSKWEGLIPEKGGTVKFWRYVTV